ncbi:MAG: MIP/aquaporin family protein [Pseudomonadota bacterium]
MTTDTTRALTAEAIGTAFLLMTVVGSGIMAARLADGNVAIALLGNTIPTGAILVVLITLFGPISGAHFNPAVTLAFWLRRQISPGLAIGYMLIQLVSGVLGTLTAHAMFEHPILVLGVTERTGLGQWLAELIASFGLVLTILVALRHAATAVPWLVGLYITAAYWFTASTSFANPAVTIARLFTDTFSGIRPIDAPAFIIAQIIGAVAAVLIASWLASAPAPAPALEAEKSQN